MTKRLNDFMRRAYPLLAAGVLLQAGGCNLDLSNTAAGVLTSIANSLIFDLVSGVFNVSLLGGF